MANDMARFGGGTSQAIEDVWPAMAIAGGAIGAYHGYKRHDSIGWAILWGLLGTTFPVIAIPVAFAQGIGERAR